MKLFIIGFILSCFICKIASRSPNMGHGFKRSQMKEVRSEPDMEIQAVRLRLVGGQSENEGRIEILHNGEWGTICDDDFDTREAFVVCRGLGYPYGGYPKDLAYFGEGDSDQEIWLDELQCIGNAENSLFDCEHDGWGKHDCAHSEDAGVVCYTDPGEAVDGTVRLVGGGDESEGRLEIYHNREWGTVCDDSFTETAAQVVCSSIAHRGGTVLSAAQFGISDGKIWLDNVECNGDEWSIVDCKRNNWGDNDCFHSEDVAVKCIPFMKRPVDQ